MFRWYMREEDLIAKEEREGSDDSDIDSDEDDDESMSDGSG